MKKGLFVSFEGGEGAGKTTLMDALIDQLERLGKPVLRTREPGGTEIGKRLREIVLTKSQYFLHNRAELLLFLADRAQHIEEVIRPSLKEGKVVFSDRFNDSTIAYQGAARGTSMEMVKTISAFACDGCTPDLTFYVDIDPVIGLQRVKRRGECDRMESETLKFHQSIRSGFLQLAKEQSGRIVVLDGSKPKEEVFQDAFARIAPLL